MGEKIKVLQVVSALNAGGVESLLYSYYTNFDKDKIQFDFVIFGESVGTFGKKFQKLGSKIYKVPYMKDKGLLYLLVKLFKVIYKNRDYDVIHVHRNLKSGIILFFAFILGIKVRIVHSHNYSPNESMLDKLKKWLLSIPISLFGTNKFACGRDASRWLYGNRAYEHGETYVMNNAINLEKYNYDEKKRIKMRESLGVNDKFVIGHIGRFSYQKNQLFLIEIFHEIYKNKPNACLFLIGNAEDEQIYSSIVEKIYKYNLQDAVKLFGAREDIPELMQAIDIFVFPSNYEGLPVVGIETQAAGLMTISSDKITEEVAITNYWKFMSLRNPAKQWAKKIMEYENGYDRFVTINELTDAGFNIKKEAKKLEDFYKNTICG